MARRVQRYGVAKHTGVRNADAFTVGAQNRTDKPNMPMCCQL